ncbi:MAG TPA: type IV pilus assembly protein PilM [Candidatus Omnitrophota bacterium]|nr:type IV pilus assembly protein PilM [Candidatus Omnitrophota bacterium]
MKTLKQKIQVFLTPQKTRSAVGLDLGSYSVKCVEMIRDENRVELASVRIERLTAGTEENLLMALRQIRTSLSSDKHVRISVSGPSVIIRNVVLPRMTKQELKSAIRFEAERHIPFHIDECLLDFQIIGQAPNKQGMKVLLVAAKKDHIQHQLKILKEAGFEPEIVDCGIFSFLNAFQKLTPEGRETTYGLLNIGHSLSSFAIVHEGELHFVREILFGGLGVTRALAEMRGVPAEAADEIKKKDAPQDHADIVTAVERGLDPLAAEIKRSVDYFENEAGVEIKAVYTAGGGARIKEVKDVLAQELGKKIVLWNESKQLLAKIGVDENFLQECFPEIGVAYGLAARGMV